MLRQVHSGCGRSPRAAARRDRAGAVSKAPYSVLVKLTERQWRLLSEAAVRRDKTTDWLAHRLLAAGIEEEEIHKAVRGKRTQPEE